MRGLGIFLVGEVIFVHALVKRIMMFQILKITFELAMDTLNYMDTLLQKELTNTRPMQISGFQ